MKEVEKILNDKKLEFEKIEIPDEMEMRLRNALRNKTLKRRVKYSMGKKIAIALIFVLLVGYNFDTLAFYTKKLIGYEQIMNGTLNQLNELGKGQSIEKSYTFKNGVTLTLDGIMLDDNGLVVFYTLKDPKQKVDTVDIYGKSIKGFSNSYHHKSGEGRINEEKTEIKFVEKFEKPLFLEKQLSLIFRYDENGKREAGEIEDGEISFTLDRSKAMSHTLKKNIDKTIKTDEEKIGFDHILASPMSTVLKGYIQVKPNKKQVKGEEFGSDGLRIELIANGKKVINQSRSISKDFNGTTFEFEYDALPTELEKLQIKLLSLSVNQYVDRQVKLEKGSDNQPINVLGQKIEIKNVYESKGNTYITICTEDSSILTKVYLITDNKSVKLKKTIFKDYTKMKDGTILHIRTLCFPETGKDLKLDIQKMTYKKIYNKTIDIAID